MVNYIYYTVFIYNIKIHIYIKIIRSGDDGWVNVRYEVYCDGVRYNPNEIQMSFCGLHQHEHNKYLTVLELPTMCTNTQQLYISRFLDPPIFENKVTQPWNIGVKFEEQTEKMYYKLVVQAIYNENYAGIFIFKVR